jgi:flagellar hook-basal body complex protein FliE
MMRIPAVSETVPLPSELHIDRSIESNAAAPGETSFGDIFAKTIQQTNQSDRAANEKVEALAAGASDDLHGTMIAVKEADISMRLVGTIRNKLLDAFNEIWKTSV